jgi:hypothetical protein
MPGHAAKVMLRFIDRIRVAAAHDRNPLQRVYEVCVSKLSDEERGELVRIIKKLSQKLEEQELLTVTGHPDQRSARKMATTESSSDSAVSSSRPSMLRWSRSAGRLTIYSTSQPE